jgi:2-polyprenyl-3-methyl-5-hydroxy-6-metoxy-1,4-benzoquinol methylase
MATLSCAAADRSRRNRTYYRDQEAVARYDAHRYSDLEGRLNNRSVWRALCGALATAPTGGRILDIPRGTGRFSWQLSRLGYTTVAGDIYLEMISVVARDPRREKGNIG